jgi:CheY-like chemotaxis protein
LLEFDHQIVKRRITAFSFHVPDRSQAYKGEVIDMIESKATFHTKETRRGWPAEPEAPPTTSRTYGVLVVDDQAEVGGVLDLAFRQEGFAVWMAVNGREAHDLYRRYGQAIDVVLLDVRMPGWDGPQTLAALRELNPQIRCCFMSGDTGRYDERQLRDLGAAAMFQKPFVLAEAAEALRELASKAD